MVICQPTATPMHISGHLAVFDITGNRRLCGKPTSNAVIRKTGDTRGPYNYLKESAYRFQREKYDHYSGNKGCVINAVVRSVVKIRAPIRELRHSVIAIFGFCTLQCRVTFLEISHLIWVKVPLVKFVPTKWLRKWQTFQNFHTNTTWPAMQLTLSLAHRWAWPVMNQTSCVSLSSVLLKSLITSRSP